MFALQSTFGLADRSLPGWCFSPRNECQASCILFYKMQHQLQVSSGVYELYSKAQDELRGMSQRMTGFHRGGFALWVDEKCCQAYSYYKLYLQSSLFMNQTERELASIWSLFRRVWQYRFEHCFVSVKFIRGIDQIWSKLKQSSGKILKSSPARKNNPSLFAAVDQYVLSNLCWVWCGQSAASLLSCRRNAEQSAKSCAK